MVVDFTEHAREKMAIHSVTEDDVRETIERGRQCRAQSTRSCRRLIFFRSAVTVIYEGNPRTGVFVITVWRSPR